MHICWKSKIIWALSWQFSFLAIKIGFPLDCSSRIITFHNFGDNMNYTLAIYKDHTRNKGNNHCERGNKSFPLLQGTGFQPEKMRFHKNSSGTSSSVVKLPPCLCSADMLLFIDLIWRCVPKESVINYKCGILFDNNGNDNNCGNNNNDDNGNDDILSFVRVLEKHWLL